MMSFTLGLFTQMSDLGHPGLLVKVVVAIIEEEEEEEEEEKINVEHNIQVFNIMCFHANMHVYFT